MAGSTCGQRRHAGRSGSRRVCEGQSATSLLSQATAAALVILSGGALAQSRRSGSGLKRGRNPRCRRSGSRTSSSSDGSVERRCRAALAHQVLALAHRPAHRGPGSRPRWKWRTRPRGSSVSRLRYTEARSEVGSVPLRPPAMRSAESGRPRRTATRAPAGERMRPGGHARGVPRARRRDRERTASGQGGEGSCKSLEIANHLQLQSNPVKPPLTFLFRVEVRSADH